MEFMRPFAGQCKKSATAVAIVIALCLPGVALGQTSSPSASRTPANFSHLAKKETPAVVAILSQEQVQAQNAPNTPLGEMLRRFGGAPQQPQARMALGSGFVIDQKGDIVTANHVIANATDIHVKFPSGVTESAKVVGSDPATDIAVLRVKPLMGMAVVHWGNSSKVEPGDWVVAIGSPFGLGGTVTVGVLSARSRNPLTGRIGGLLQTDAAINKGNSGGPLFDAEGDVIGVNDAIISPSGGNIGIGFAVPSEIAEDVADELMKNGKVVRGYIGAEIQDVTKTLAKALGLQKTSGALIASVESGGPADQAGLKPGDVITKVGSHQILNSRDLVHIISSDKPGTNVNITAVTRSGKKSVNVKLGERPMPQKQAEAGRGNKASKPSSQQNGMRLGIEVAPYAGSQNEKGPRVSGLAVMHVAPGSPAAKNGLQRGDIIVSADGKSVKQPSALAHAWKNDRQANKPILLRIFRRGHYSYLAVG